MSTYREIYRCCATLGAFGGIIRGGATDFRHIGGKLVQGRTYPGLSLKANTYPQQNIFSSDFGHFILKIEEKK